MKENKEKLISLFEAAKHSPYDQEYLSLRARNGRLKAQKVGRKWYTTREWLNEYISENKPDFAEQMHTPDRRKLIIFGSIALVALILVIYSMFFTRDDIKTEESEFTPEEIIGLPDDQGNMEYYGWGKVKLNKVE